MTVRRHACALCGKRKREEEFPLTLQSTRSLTTCTHCLSDTIHDHTWLRLGLRPPSSRNIVEASGVQPQPQIQFENITQQGSPAAVESSSGHPVSAGAVADSSVNPNPGDNTPTGALAAGKSRPRKRKHRTSEYWILRNKKRKCDTNPRPTPLQSRQFTCRICAEEKPYIAFPNHRRKADAVPNQCRQHLSATSKSGPVCIECIGQYLAATLDLSANVERLGCLEPGCKEPWAWQYIMLYLPWNAVAKYSKKMLDMLTAGQNFLWCPNDKCTAGGLLEKKTHGYPRVVCYACNQWSCAECRIVWHEGETCQTHRIRNGLDGVSQEEKELLKTLQGQEAKRCPRCQMIVVKDGGCDHMHCQNCSRDFYWSLAELVRLDSSQRPDSNAFYLEKCEFDPLDIIT